MIYIKNIREMQSIYIPRTELGSESYVAVKNDYDSGYRDGVVDGKNAQKAKLTQLVVTKNGLYGREDGWDSVDVNVAERTFKTQEKSVNVTKNIVSVEPDNGYDALSKVNVDATSYGQQKHNEGYTKGKEDGVEEGYNQGYLDGKLDTPEVTLTKLEVTPKWEDRDIYNCVNYYPTSYNSTGFSSASINIETIYNQGKELGYNNGTNEGYADGKEDGIKEGYNQGYEKGYDNGKTVGTSEGYNQGYSKGYSDGQENYVAKIKIVDYGVKIKGSTFTKVPEWMDFEGAKNMNEMFRDCKSLAVVNDINTSAATSMRYMFWYCESLTTVDLDTRNVTDMECMFENCTELTSVQPLDASKLVIYPYITYGVSSIFGSINLLKLTDFGGLIGLKASSIGSNGFVRTPNLTYQSCLNVLNGLYDFTGNGQTPSTNQGQLKVHQNFLTTVGDEITIAINKGWTITA